MARRPRRNCAKYAPKYHGSPAGTMAHCLRTLAGFLRPPQTYELCLTAKAFHVKENGVPRATRALRVSLERSLARVLKARGVPAEAVDFKALVDAEGRPGALISGSTMVQCVLGTVWYGDEDRAAPRALEYWGDEPDAYKIDVDVFATVASAPAVRSKLCGSGLTLSTLDNDGGDYWAKDNGNGMTGKSLECRVHHTEGYALTPEDGYLFDEWDSEDEAFSLAQATAWARGPGPCEPTRVAANRPSVFEGRYACDDQDWDAPEYRIRAAADTDAFSYDFRLESEKLVDLVVAKSDVADARDLLASFDLDICKTSWDGRVFRIEDPHRAFRSETLLDPRRLELMRAFADKLLEKDPKENDTYLPLDTWDTIRQVLGTPQEGHPKWDLEMAARIDGLSLQTIDREPWYHHNWFAKLFIRQAKYRERGVRLLDVPQNFATVAERIGVEYHSM